MVDTAILAALLESVADRVTDSDVPRFLERISNEGVAGGLREAAARLEGRHTVACTEVSARWCPVHGTCSCPEGARDLEDPLCPLHSLRSEHAATFEAADV